MKNFFLTLATLLIAGAFLSLSAQHSRFSLDIRGGANLSDLNYGYQLFNFENFFSRNDYIFFGEGGQGDYGMHVGIGASARVFKRFLLFGGVDYARLYGVDARVDSLRLFVTRPPSPNLPIMADGVVAYSFINVRTGLPEFLVFKPRAGLQIPPGRKNQPRSLHRIQPRIEPLGNRRPESAGV